MNKASILLILPICAAGTLPFPTYVHSAPADLEEAKSLLKQMHEDQCQQQELRGKVMLAHRNHDEATLKELWPKIEAISQRLKPSEERMKALKASIKQNPEEQNAFESVLLQETECS